MIAADRSLHDIRNLFDLTGKIAFVTGGGSGLGFAVARGFAGFGARVAIADISGEAAKSSAEAIAKETGHDAMGFEVDVTRPEMVEKAHVQVRSSTHMRGHDVLEFGEGEIEERLAAIVPCGVDQDIDAAPPFCARKRSRRT